MASPSEFLYPILQEIETAVIALKDEYAFLQDKDIEWCYGQLKDYYRKKSFNKPSEEPESKSTAKQDLMDEILNVLDERAENGLDSHLLNAPLYTHGGNTFLNINQVYLVCFSSLIKSVRLWRKNKNAPSYLAHIKGHL
jgi:transcriptional regulator of heat shock response